MTSPLETAAQRLRSAQSTLVGALDAAQRGADEARAAAHRRAQSELSRQQAVARNKAAQAVSEHSLAARDIAAAITRPSGGALDVADHVTLGRLATSGAASGVNAEIALPFLLPLVGRGNLVLDVPAARRDGLVARVVRAALEATAPGQLDVIAYDPRLSGVLAPFSPLRSTSDAALQVHTSPAELERVVHELVADVQRVSGTLRGVSESLIDFRVAAGHPVERFQLVVLLDYPEGVEESLHRQVLSLARAGVAAGITFVFAGGAGGSGEERARWRDVEREAGGAILREEAGTLRWVAHPELELDVVADDPAELARLVDGLVQRAVSAPASVVPFERVQPLEPTWPGSSADGLRFAIGLDGPDVAEIALGDERDQRHNILVTGAVGQGKSNLLKVMIHSLAQRYPPDELELFLLDFKEGVTLYPMAPTPSSPDYLPHARVLGLESDRDFGLSVLRHLEAEFARRAKLFRPYGDSIARYRAAVPDAVMPRIVVVVDEFHLLFDPNDATAEAAAQLLEAIARRGRSYGVHLVLASQTISGISALMAREGGIFAQFPIRLALKNAVQESFATLGQGNDAAARLRVRGEAILNLDYGQPDSNRRIVVAVASDDQLATLRHAWWLAARGRAAPPRVFDGSRRIRLADAVGALRDVRARRASAHGVPVALLGFPIEVSEAPIGVPLAAEPGRHLALLGAGESSGADPGADPVDNALGALQAAAVSLALQHPAGDAEFVSLEALDEQTLARNGHEQWLAAMANVGYPVRRVPRAEVAACLAELAADLEGRDADSVPRYVLGFGLDRAAALDVPDMFAHRPAEDLQQVLRLGSVTRVHVLAWWANAATFRSHIGFGGDGFVDALLMLRLDQGSVQELLSPFITWSVRDNRGLLADRTQLAAPTAIVPFSPMTARDVATLAQTDWEV